MPDNTPVDAPVTDASQAPAAPTEPHDASAPTLDASATPVEAPAADAPAITDAPKTDDAAPSTDTPAAPETGTDAPAQAPSADEPTPAVDDASAPDASATTTGESGEDKDAPAPSAIADDGNVISKTADSAPLASDTPAVPANAGDATAPATGEDSGTDDEDKGVASSGPIGDIKNDNVNDPNADKESDDKPNSISSAGPIADLLAEQKGDDKDDKADPGAGIEPQPTSDDAAKAKPLSAMAPDESTPALDAMPSEAQQHMGGWVKGVDEAEPAEPGQLPTAADLPGTPMDATAAGTYDTYPGNTVDSGDEDDDESDADAEDGADVDSDGSEDGYFGDAKVQHAPLADVAGDGLDALKEAAEQAALAQNHLQSVPLSVLDIEHKDLLADARDIIGKLLKLAGRLFERNEG